MVGVQPAGRGFGAASLAPVRLLDDARTNGPVNDKPSRLLLAVLATVPLKAGAAQFGVPFPPLPAMGVVTIPAPAHAPIAVPLGPLELTHGQQPATLAAPALFGDGLGRARPAAGFGARRIGWRAGQRGASIEGRRARVCAAFGEFSPPFWRPLFVVKPLWTGT